MPLLTTPQNNLQLRGYVVITAPESAPRKFEINTPEAMLVNALRTLAVTRGIEGTRKLVIETMGEMSAEWFETVKELYL